MLQVIGCSSKTHRHPPETSLETHAALLENGHLCYFCSTGSMIAWDTRIKIFKSNTMICKKNKIECPWDFFFLLLNWVSVQKSKSHTATCIAVEYVSIVWNGGEFWGPAGKACCLYAVWISISFHWEKRIAAQQFFFASYFVIASKIFSRFNFGFPANKSMDISRGEKSAEASLIHHSLWSRSKGAWSWTFSTSAAHFNCSSKSSILHALVR